MTIVSRRTGDAQPRGYDLCVINTPDYSLIVPAFNEERQLPRTLPAIQAAMAGVALQGELIVVDNNSADATAEVAKAHGARVVFEPVNMIGKARNAGAKAASAPLLIFVDADTTPSAELVQAALEALRDPGCSVGGARIEMDPPPNWPARRALGSWNLLSRWLGWPAGCFFFCRRDAFDAVGGFNETLYASEEVWLARRLKKWGKTHGLRATILTVPVVTSSRKTENPLRFLSMMLIMLVFPFAVRYRGLCGYWYKRKDEPAETA